MEHISASAHSFGPPLTRAEVRTVGNQVKVGLSTADNYEMVTVYLEPEAARQLAARLNVEAEAIELRAGS
jgi:hypothetical protein